MLRNGLARTSLRSRPQELIQRESIFLKRRLGGQFDQEVAGGRFQSGKEIKQSERQRSVEPDVVVSGKQRSFEEIPTVNETVTVKRQNGIRMRPIVRWEMVLDEL